MLRLNWVVCLVRQVVAPFEDTHWGTKEMIVCDPDGRQWSLQAPAQSHE